MHSRSEDMILGMTSGGNELLCDSHSSISICTCCSRNYSGSTTEQQALCSSNRLIPAPIAAAAARDIVQQQ